MSNERALLLVASGREVYWSLAVPSLRPPGRCLWLSAFSVVSVQIKRGEFVMSSGIVHQAPRARSRSDRTSATVLKPGKSAISFSDRSHFWTFFSAEMTVAWLRPPK